MTIEIRNKNWSAFQCVYGGPGGIRTPVQDAFTLKGLQLFFYLLAEVVGFEPTVPFDTTV